jgi:hypothetical protein
MISRVSLFEGHRWGFIELGSQHLLPELVSVAKTGPNHSLFVPAMEVGVIRSPLVWQVLCYAIRQVPCNTE